MVYDRKSSELKIRKKIKPKRRHLSAPRRQWKCKSVREVESNIYRAITKKLVNLIKIMKLTGKTPFSSGTSKYNARYDEYQNGNTNDNSNY